MAPPPASASSREAKKESSFPQSETFSPRNNPSAPGDRQHRPAVLDGLEAFPTFASEVVYLLVENLDHLIRTVNRSSEFPPFPLPPVDAVHLCASPSLFSVNFLAELALLRVVQRLHDEFHTTRFTRAVFSVAVLSKMSPFPIAAGKFMLIEEAHV